MFVPPVPCQIVATQPDGSTWRLEVDASSVYDAIRAYHYRVIAGDKRNDIPRPEPNTLYQITLPDGRKLPARRWNTTRH